MSTEPQIAANQANAQPSTGPNPQPVKPHLRKTADCTVSHSPSSA